MEPMTMLIYGVGLFLLAIVFLKFFSAVWYVVRFHGFRMERTGDDIRIRCGLFTKVSATVPRRRIQFISIHRQWLGRYLGLVSMRVETAGGGAESEDASTTVGRRWFMPALLESDVPKLLKEIRPDLDWKEDELDWKPLSPLAARRMVRLSLVVCLVAAVLGGIFWWPWGPAVGLVLLPITIWLSRRKARATRYARTDSFVAFRSGMVTRKWSFTFFDKIQAVQYAQSPFDRRWNMASLTIDTAGAGPAEHKIAIEYLDADFAQSEHEFLTARASQSSWAIT
jgi:putative membrane protein